MSLRLRVIYKHKTMTPSLVFLAIKFTDLLLTLLKIQGDFNRITHIIQVSMFGMCLFTRDMDLGKNHPCLHASKGSQLSVGLALGHALVSILSESARVPDQHFLVSHCSVKASPCLSHCSQRTIMRQAGTTPGSSSPCVAERQKCDSNRSQGPRSASSPSITADVLAT